MTRRSQARPAFFFFGVNVAPTIRTTIVTTRPLSPRRLVERLRINVVGGVMSEGEAALSDVWRRYVSMDMCR
jgi:hypothetical protein